MQCRLNLLVFCRINLLISVSKCWGAKADSLKSLNSFEMLEHLTCSSAFFAFSTRSCSTKLGCCSCWIVEADSTTTELASTRLVALLLLPPSSRSSDTNPSNNDSSGKPSSSSTAVCLLFLGGLPCHLLTGEAALVFVLILIGEAALVLVLTGEAALVLV